MGNVEDGEQGRWGTRKMGNMEDYDVEDREHGR